MADKFEWLPILTRLGEETLARILDNSPDIQSAILEAHQNFEAAEKEAEELRKRGHVDPNAGDPPPPPPPPPGEIPGPG